MRQKDFAKIPGRTEKKRLSLLVRFGAFLLLVCLLTTAAAACGDPPPPADGDTDEHVSGRLPDEHTEEPAGSDGASSDSGSDLTDALSSGITADSSADSSEPASDATSAVSSGAASEATSADVSASDAAASEAASSLSSQTSADGESSEAETGGELLLSFVGDCMLATIRGENRPDTLNYEMDRQDPTFFFRYVAPYFEEDDFTMANCENVFTDRKLPAVTKNHTPAYWYRSAAKNAGIFRASSIEGVSVCNNHTGDYGEEGYADTMAALDAAGVIHGGSGRPLYFEKYGLRVGIICANLYSDVQAEGILRQINALRNDCGYIVVYFHGGKERIHQPEDWKIAACRRLAEAGADLILGCHPHVLQPMEEYTRSDGQTSYIVYSLGNFLFGGGRTEENRTAIFRLRLTVENGAAVTHRLEVIPCYVYATLNQSTPECWIPKPMEDGAAKEKVLAFLRGEAETPK